MQLVDFMDLSSLLGVLWISLLMVWGFQARNRINVYFGLSHEDPRWFHGFWTLLFTPLYFNYKINTILTLPLYRNYENLEEDTSRHCGQTYLDEWLK